MTQMDTDERQYSVSELMRWNPRSNPLTQVLSSWREWLFFVSWRLCARNGTAMTGWFWTVVSKMSKMGVKLKRVVLKGSLKSRNDPQITQMDTDGMKKTGKHIYHRVHRGHGVRQDRSQRIAAVDTHRNSLTQFYLCVSAPLR